MLGARGCIAKSLYHAMSLRYFHLHEYIFTAVSVLLLAWFAVVFGIYSTSIMQRVIARGEALYLRYECY